MLRLLIPSNPQARHDGPATFNLGFAYVGVNMRGTGCSGGSFRYFEPLQSLDGYDMIETVAAQPWGQYHSGRDGGHLLPRHHAAVRRADPAAEPWGDHAAVGVRRHLPGTLYPGGILNTGFAVPWAKERAEDAEPYGQGWTRPLAAAGDTVCAANQALRLQNPTCCR